MLLVARESPRQHDVIALIRQSGALMQSLYPANSSHRVDIDYLARSAVHLFVARQEGAGPRLRRLRPRRGW